MDIEQRRTQEIVTLHQEIVGHLRQSLDKAIRIGQLLTEQKDSLKHGEFTPWLRANVPFTDRTARNYMRLYREKDRIKTESISDLNGAYFLLADQRENDCFDPNVWSEIIDDVNSIFFRHAPDIRIPSEPGILFHYLKEKDDGSMTDQEKLGFSFWANFHSHLCYWRNFARTKGKECLPPSLKRYLDVMMEDKPDWLTAIRNEPPKKICGESCPHGF